MEINLEPKVEIQAKTLPTLQIAFEQCFKAEASVFIDIILHAHKQTISDLSPKGLKYQMRMTKSTLMNGNIKGLLFDQFPNEMKESKTGRFYLHRAKEFILLFKKLNDKSMPSNINTRNARKIFAQLALDFDEALPIVFMGFTVSNTWEQIKHIRAVYIKDGKKVWIADLLKQIDSADLFSTTTQSEITPAFPEELQVKPKIKGKNNQKAS